MAGQVRSYLTWSTVGALLAGGLAYAFWPRPIPADFGTVTRGPMQVTVGDEGRTRVKDAFVVSAPLAGRLRRIELKAGDAVETGKTVVASIRPTDPTFLDIRARRQAEAGINAAEDARDLAAAEVRRAEAEATFAEQDFARAKKLTLGSSISQRDLDRYRLDYETKRAALAAARATLNVRSHELETARAALIGPETEADGEAPSERCCVSVRAPVSGRVLRLLQESETVVTAGTPLVEIGDPRDLEIVVELLSTDAVKVRKGAPVIIGGWGGEGTLAGIVRRVEPYGFTKISALGVEEQRVNVIGDFTDPPERADALGHGYRVDVSIVTWQADEVMRVPIGGLFREGADWAVFAVEDGRARLTKVMLGHMNGTDAEVLSGLAPGATVVLHPSDRVVDGARVESRVLE
jgi:HlyD family secretion protein